MLITGVIYEIYLGRILFTIMLRQVIYGLGICWFINGVKLNPLMIHITYIKGEAIG